MSKYYMVPIVGVFEDFETCCWYKEGSCCSSDTVNKVYTKVFETILANVTGGEPTDCYFALTDLICSNCAPNSADFMTGTKNKTTIHLTTSFCDSMYSDCKNVTGLTTNNTATNGDEFCTMMFEDYDRMDVAVSSSSDKKYYNGTSFHTVKHAGCVPGWSQTSDSDSPHHHGFRDVVIGVLIVGVVAICAVAGVWFWRKRQEKLALDSQMI
eukprot:TRINITY_DN1468_c0_g2_i1.p1 TRINITY_DN1468_c0_g2~~TRINITY_DN1468_c0_g2_i1.p1  ORF type:complete len:211 (+),score=30.40 TRINITY_DN1468_c0_g2_i1:440-1072(+)